MKVYRIAKTEQISDLSGVGAKIYGGRWNHRGVAIIYTSESRSLATVEYLFHVPQPFAPVDLSIATIEIPDDIVPEEIASSALPKSWRHYPAPSKLANLGTSWASEKRSLLLRVPSAVVENEYNILINPAHENMTLVTLAEVEKYTFDRRLLRKK